MSRLMMSNSEVQAICRNRSEQRNLSGKLDQIDQTAFQSKDAIQQDLKTWRKFRRENVKNSGWSPKSIRPEPGEDVLNPGSSTGRMSGAPHSPTQGKETSFTKPWAYSYSQVSHNKVYKELTQSSQNSQKTLDLSLKSTSFDSPTEDDQPAMLKHVKTVQALNKATSALTPFHDKLLTLRQNDEPNSTMKPGQENSKSSTAFNKMISKVSTIQTLNRFSTLCMKDKEVKEGSDSSESAADKLVNSVNAMRGLTRSKNMFACYGCGQNADCPNKEDKLPQVALAYTGLQRAQTALKLSIYQKTSEPDTITLLDEEKPKPRRCCLECLKKHDPKLKNEIKSKGKATKKLRSKSNVENPQKATKKSRSKSNVENPQIKIESTSISEFGTSQRRLSSVSDISGEQIRRLRIAKEKVSKCFELSSYDDTANCTMNSEANDEALLTETGESNMNSSSEAVSKARVVQETHSQTCVDKESNMAAIAVQSNDAGSTDVHKQDLVPRKVSTKKKHNSQNVSTIKNKSLQSLNEAFQELDLHDGDFSTGNNSMSMDSSEQWGATEKDTRDFAIDYVDEDEYPSDISQQHVMKVIQEEVIDKLNKLKDKGKSPPCVRKFSTISKASTVFKLGAQRKKKVHKASGMDVFTRIAKYMLLEVWKRRQERKAQLEHEEINKSCKKITQAKFREKFLALTKLSDQKLGFGGAEDNSFASVAQFQWNRRSAVNDASVDNFNNGDMEERFQHSHSSNFSRSFEDNSPRENFNTNWANNTKSKQPEQNIYENYTSESDLSARSPSSPKKALWGKTKTGLKQAISSHADSINNNVTNQNYKTDPEDKVHSNKNYKSNYKNQSDNNHHLNDDNSSFAVDNENDEDNNDDDEDDDTSSLDPPGTTRLLPHQISKRRKPPWMAGNENLHHHLRPEVYHKGIRLSNYVCPEKRYLTARRQKSKKDLSVRWHSAVGAMVNKHEISQEPMLPEKTFPKQARHRALNKMIEANHTPAPDDTAKIQNDILHSRIQNFLQSVEPYRKK